MNHRIIGLISLCFFPFAAVSQDDEEETDAQQIEDVVERFYEAWNQMDYVAAEDLVGPSVIEFDMRDRKEPQSWVLRKMQTREEFLDAIVSEWTDTVNPWYYNQDTHKYIKEVEFFDISVWDDLAIAIVRERLVGLSGPASSWQSSAWLLRRIDGTWKIGGVLYEVPVDSEGVWIEHHSYDLPGRHGDGDGFSPTHINGVAWQPIWQGAKTRKVYFREQIELSPDFNYTLVEHRVRDIAQIEVQPETPGDPLSILFADNDSGADWYDVEVRWSAEAPDIADEETPEPMPPGREDLLLEVLFDGEIRDTSPHQRPLENEKVVFTPDRGGNEDGSGYFNGEAVVDIEGFTIDHPFSISIWAKYDDIKDHPHWWNNCIWAQDNGGGVRVFQLSTVGRRVTLHRMRDGDVHSKLYIKKERWYHLVGVYDGDFHRLFVDGVFQNHLQSTVKPSPDQPIYIGAKNLDETGFFFTGALDDARLYGRALTVAEINALYRGLAE